MATKIPRIVEKTAERDAVKRLCLKDTAFFAKIFSYSCKVSLPSIRMLFKDRQKSG